MTLKSSIKLTSLAVVAVIGLLMMIYSLFIGGWKALSVQTGSMRPAIDVGSLVLVHKVPAADIHVGDVITYLSPQDKRVTITHRVKEITVTQTGTRRYIVQGDANIKADPPVYASSVVGKVEHHVPFAGRIVNFIRSPLGLALIIYVPALAIIISEIKRLAAYYKSQQPYIIEGYTPHLSMQQSHRFGAAKTIALLVLFASLTLVPLHKAFAAFHATATLTHNTFSSATTPPPGGGSTTSCSVTNQTNVSVRNNNSQSATTDTVHSQQNTNIDGASSGNATNSSSTTVQIGVNNQSSCSSNQ